jgi:hypothetical protein
VRRETKPPGLRTGRWFRGREIFFNAKRYVGAPWKGSPNRAARKRGVFAPAWPEVIFASGLRFDSGHPGNLPGYEPGAWWFWRDPMDRKMVTIDGNEAAGYLAYKTNEVIAIYPITPSRRHEP